MTTPKIVEINERLVAGLRIRTSLAENKTFELWTNFKQRIAAVQRIRSNQFYSIQKFPDDISFQTFDPSTQFEKWAAAAMEDFDTLPDEFESFAIPGGRYAVFIHHGPPSKFAETSRYIFGEWLPESGMQLDKRVHFEIFKSDYRPDDPNATEEVWIPIRKPDER
jgi:AraC family transcriptional regulator